MYDSTIHHRRSMRLRGYDYSRPGAYFVTICAHDQLNAFGKIVEGETLLNETGRMVQAIWMQMPNHYRGCEVGAFVVMPDHVHGIIFITGVGAGPRAWPGSEMGRAQGPALTLSLGDLVQRFKSLTTTRYRQGPRPAAGRLWQRNYYEHIIRDEIELEKVRQYIATNPVRWEMDWENIMRSS
jgi:REP-associated tyrosine transposase